ncbi:MAG: sugar kinase [Chitinophagaceae bacterium]|nr:MAG: sugar kinase [Chitinophagaceae bacterium]
MKIVCFGEILLRYCPDVNADWVQQNAMTVYIGGAELNVASALSKWGLGVDFCTVLPENYLSQTILKAIEKRDIDVSKISFSGNRVGAYYLPVGSELKNAGVIYDRAHSSFFNLQKGMIDWEEVFVDCDWFHFSAICPALNENIAVVCEEALQVARNKNVVISMDLNYRKNLWQYGIAPHEVMNKLMPYCDVVMGNIWSIEALCAVENTVDAAFETSKSYLMIAGEKSITELKNKYPNIQTVALTFRFDQIYWAMMGHSNEYHISKVFSNYIMNDRVGSGDCFMAGMIYGIANQWHPKNIVDFASAAAVGKLAEKGDSTNQSVDQILNKVHE